MNKVICDVCGTDYPETEPRCPICDCVRSEGGQTSAGNTQEGGYTYVRGGRFSRSNVRKRLKASQKAGNRADTTLPIPAKIDVPEEQENLEEDEDGFDEEELDGVSNRGLMIIVLLLLLAIVVLTSYIVIEFFNIPEKKDHSQSTTSSQVTTADPEPTVDPTPVEKPCTGILVSDTSVSLTEIGQTAGIKSLIVLEPEDTTDVLSFTSKDAMVVTVDEDGTVTAMGAGATTITIKCGDVEKELSVVCQIKTEEPGEDDPGTVEPPVEVVKLELRYTDVTLDAIYPTLQLYNGKIDMSQITWTSSNEKIVTVDKGLVTPVALGSAKITAQYQDQKVTCMVHVSQKALDKLGIGQEPDTPDQPDDPVEPQVYSLKVNGNDPKWDIDGRANTADVSLVIGGADSVRITIVDETGAVVAVSWNINDTSVVAYDASIGKFVAKAPGKATLKTEYEGISFEVIIRVS